MSKKEKLDQAMLRVGIQHHEAGRLAAAEEIYRDLLKEHGKDAKVLHLLAVLTSQTGRLDEGIKLLRRSIEAQPRDAAAHYHLGNFYKERGQLDQAVEAFREALRLKPDFFEAQLNLGTVQHLGRQLDAAIESFRRAMRITPENARAHSNLLYTLHFHPGQDGRSILEAHRAWDAAHARKYRSAWPAHANVRDPERRLRIGYVSPDLKDHVVGRFMVPLMAHHDHERFEIFGYAGVAKPDAVTERLKKYADQWRWITGATDDQLARQVQQDQIDVLVDLTMHMDATRLMVFARKPAPVQVTYLAYASTTGMEAMDYRISDPHLDPPGGDESVYVEKTLRLGKSYWCYEEPVGAGASGVLPSASGGGVTFGCLNNFTKVSDAALATWARILMEMPESRLILHAYPGGHRDWAARLLRERGVATKRVEFVGMMSTEKYFGQYGQIDIALDPFPYCGGTTTCDALWMGVPVVTLRGETAVGRGGVSILSNVGLSDLVAQTQDDYVRIAVGLARDMPRLQKLRAELRAVMRASPLMDAAAFAREMEIAYRTMWRNWCNIQP